MGKGSAIPKGRYALPREAKSVSKDRILVFAEGRQAEEAKRAGADIVGGPELVDGVSQVPVSQRQVSLTSIHRSSVVATRPLSSSVRRLLFETSRLNWVVFSVQGASCLPSVEEQLPRTLVPIFAG